MRIFKNKEFNRWAKRLNVTDKVLINAIDEITKGLYEANLGGHIYKKRIGIENKDKRGGARTILAYKTNSKSFFIYGFAKNNKANITDEELAALKDIAKLYLSYTEKELEKAIEEKKIFEVQYEKIYSSSST